MRLLDHKRTVLAEKHEDKQNHPYIGHRGIAYTQS